MVDGGQRSTCMACSCFLSTAPVNRGPRRGSAASPHDAGHTGVGADASSENPRSPDKPEVNRGGQVESVG